VVRSREPHFTVSVRPSALRVLADYVRLGIDHILSGADHLLFVFGLVLLVGGARRVAATVTAFTIGHSITLAAVTLDLVRVPAAPAELLIALSVFVLAVELARPGQPVTLVRRFSGLMAGTFGLLHGFGFAGSLREAGLPSGDVPLALLGFNVGVEFGQIAFVACVLVARRALDRLPLPAARLERVPVYVMGSLAALWCFQRAGALLP
jgi:hydrogenase/urease accessory protein HupE